VRPSGRILIDYRHVDAGQLSQAELDAFFTRKSTGDNILHGVGNLVSANPGRCGIEVYRGSSSWFASHNLTAALQGDIPLCPLPVDGSVAVAEALWVCQAEPHMLSPESTRRPSPFATAFW
jgi:hypothetical protein